MRAMRTWYTGNRGFLFQIKQQTKWEKKWMVRSAISLPPSNPSIFHSLWIGDEWTFTFVSQWNPSSSIHFFTVSVLPKMKIRFINTNEVVDVDLSTCTTVTPTGICVILGPWCSSRAFYDYWTWGGRYLYGMSKYSCLRSRFAGESNWKQMNCLLHTKLWKRVK